jgi:hypothetical protein
MQRHLEEQAKLVDEALTLPLKTKADRESRKRKAS